MVMVPPMDNTDAVVNAKVVIPVVVRCATLSSAAIVRTTFAVDKPSFGKNVPQFKALATSVDVQIETHAN